MSFLTAIFSILAWLLIIASYVLILCLNVMQMSYGYVLATMSYNIHTYASCALRCTVAISGCKVLSGQGLCLHHLLPDYDSSIPQCSQ